MDAQESWGISGSLAVSDRLYSGYRRYTEFCRGANRGRLPVCLVGRGPRSGREARQAYKAAEAAKDLQGMKNALGQCRNHRDGARLCEQNRNQSRPNRIKGYFGIRQTTAENHQRRERYNRQSDRAVVRFLSQTKRLQSAFGRQVRRQQRLRPCLAGCRRQCGGRG